MANRFIRWTRLEDYQELSRNFEIVNTLGALDASEFEIRQPLNQLPSYTSRKCKTTIKLQIVSTRDLEIIDAAVGFPGSLGDSRILKNSPLSQALGVRLGQTDYHILADTAYPLREHILVPFRNNRDLEDHELAYNRAVKSDRQVVERAFGLLKMKWRRLKFLDIFKMNLRHDGWIDDAPQIDDDDEVDPDYEFDEERETEAGVEKRRRIAEEFIF
ncbi:putative nuclease HARBI1 [Daphnia pulicaria]|uniref:putative nuclease HARBI1 n=1 Tax=Daphnia pulicaria TaxID=35523 RepID=UPI001EEA3FDF|nr:putative nuclease HARBI1 [Daphnia pulicaria]